VLFKDLPVNCQGKIKEIKNEKKERVKETNKSKRKSPKKGMEGVVQSVRE
jgi:hypothetical protein